MKIFFNSGYSAVVILFEKKKSKVFNLNEKGGINCVSMIELLKIFMNYGR